MEQKNNENIGTCALCKKESVRLEKSHIIPKFVFKRIVKKSPTGFMRNPFEPNKRIQDGDKLYLLCGECEDLFNVSETKFANNIFHPYKNGTLKEFKYQKWLNYFITSVNWRTLYLDIIDFKLEKSLIKERLDVLMKSEEIMRDYLLNKRNDISNIKNHIFFFDDIKITDKKTLDAGTHTFFRHSSFGYTFISHDHNSYYIICNISGILICTILKRNVMEIWENTLVNIDNGNLKIINQRIKSPIIAEITEYMYEARELQKNMSENQREKIIDSLKKNPSKLINSEIYKNKLLDEKLKNTIK